MGFMIEIIEHHDPTGQTMVAKYPPDDSTDIKMGAQLVVQETQVAFFLRDGRILDKFGPGRHTLSTANVPILTRLLSLPYGFKSPFRANVIFVSTKDFLNLKWGTPEPILFRDKELQMVRLRARGIFSIRIDDPETFLMTVAGTTGRISTPEVEAYLRNLIVTQVSEVLGAELTTVFDLATRYDEIGAAVRSRVAESFSVIGVSLNELLVSAISLPEEVQKIVDERTGLHAAGDLDQFMKFKAAKALGDMAKSPGGGGQGMGLGFGAAFGMMMPGMMQQASGPPPPPPRALPPVPAAPLQVTAPTPLPAGPAVGTFCPVCGMEVPAGAKFCMHCGKSTASAGCVKCQAALPAGAKFCMNCGLPV